MSNKNKFKFTIKKVYIMTLAIVAIVGTIVLAQTTRIEPIFGAKTWTPVLSGEKRPLLDDPMAVSRGQKVHDFVNTWGKYGNALRMLGTLHVSESLFIAKNAYIGFSGANTAGSPQYDLYAYGDIQLSTAPLLSNANNSRNCTTGNIGRIRLKMPVNGTTACPLMICYPGTQGANSGISRKSACDDVTIPGGDIRNQVGIMDGGAVAID